MSTSNGHPTGGRPEDSEGPHILIVEARYYDEIADLLLEGCEKTLREAGATFDRVTVPGALEVPQAVGLALESEMYDGYVALGCVIRGETYHFEIVAGESARGLMDLALEDGVVIGNGILTVENKEQARVRADPNGKNKGGEAASAVLSLLGLKACFGLDDD
ncbi:MAG: 6,7-dimethyl-8-ribityllumazine synthase [Geminicoccaceae bacterium]